MRKFRRSWMNMESRRSRIFIVLLLTFILASCQREQRRFEEISPGTTPGPVRLSALQPGPPVPALPEHTYTPYDNNAYAMNEGKRMFEWMNCVGCHAHGGGGIGPALMDDEWIYGSDAAQIFSSIAEGRPNGMPSFAGKIQTQQIWQIVAYVRSLNGLVHKDAAPGRDDHLNVKPAEMQTRTNFPVNTRARTQ